MFTLPELEYEFDALEPHIDADTMEIHHDKHHQGYIDKLNAALREEAELLEKSVEELLMMVEDLPSAIQTAVKNHGGGHANHSLFWQILSPHGGGEPKGELLKAIDENFNSFSEFKEKFSEIAGGHFGSGWAWLVVDDDGDLQVYSTANQDSPLMEGDIPILGLDVWEHAYYLNYQNKRGDYINSFWHVVNWPAVAKLFQAARE